jgi:hypothetical protein
MKGLCTSSLATSPRSENTRFRFRDNGQVSFLFVALLSQWKYRHCLANGNPVGANLSMSYASSAIKSQDHGESPIYTMLLRQNRSPSAKAPRFSGHSCSTGLWESELIIVRSSFLSGVPYPCISSPKVLIRTFTVLSWRLWIPFSDHIHVALMSCPSVNR